MPRYLWGAAASLFYCVAALAQTGAQTGGIEIKDAWARATPGGAQTGAAYLTLLSPTGDRLTGVTSPAAEKAELHQMTNDGGIMKMEGVARLRALGRCFGGMGYGGAFDPAIEGI